MKIVTPPLSRNPIFTQKKGGAPQNQTKIQLSPIELKFSGKIRPNKGLKLGKKIFTPPKPKSNFYAKKGGAPQNQAKIQLSPIELKFSGKARPNK